MDKDRIKGKVKDISGRVERQVGEWTGNEKAQAEGAGKQVAGKIQNTLGKVKDKARDLRDEFERKRMRDRDRDVVEEKKVIKIKRPGKAA